LTINWGGYAVAVKSGYVIEASFAYLILPVLLITVGHMLSRVVHRSSIICIILCLAIIAFECYLKGVFPIIGFAIAAPFAVYILWHSKYNLEPVKALFYETSLMLPIGIIILPTVNFALISDWELIEMLYLSILGILTVLPLLLFVSSTKVVSFDILSIYQLLSPVLGISIGIVLYNQSIEGHTYISYSALILILILYNLYLFSTKAKNHV
jgi:chloramphenicol-sensitive protein RarD